MQKIQQELEKVGYSVYFLTYDCKNITHLQTSIHDVHLQTELYLEHFFNTPNFK